MDPARELQQALDYLEAHMDSDIDDAQLAVCLQGGVYHFQKLFSMLTGITLNEYIRMRRMTLAAAELQKGERVIDVALKYGYDSPDSFARAFARFHGIPPSEARQPGARLNTCSPLHIKLTLEGCNMMDYRMEHRPAQTLLGFKRHFDGAPFGAARGQQEEQLFVSTRASQWILRGMSRNEYDQDIVAIANVTGNGYDFWYAANPDAFSLEHLYDPAVTGIDFMDRFGFQTLTVEEGDYAVFRTSRSQSPVNDYMDLRKQIATDWLLGAGFILRDAPELAVYHWYYGDHRSQRFVEIWIPIKK